MQVVFKIFRRIMQFLGEHDQAIGTVLIVAVLFIVSYYKNKQVKEEGIFTIAKLIRFVGAESGSSLYIDIYLNNKVYHTSVNEDFEKGGIGKFYFIKVLKNAPTDYPILYGYKQVPSCILENVKDYKGWNRIPDCDNYLKFIEK